MTVLISTSFSGIESRVSLVLLFTVSIYILFGLAEWIHRYPDMKRAGFTIKTIWGLGLPFCLGFSGMLALIRLYRWLKLLE